MRILRDPTPAAAPASGGAAPSAPAAPAAAPASKPADAKPSAPAPDAGGDSEPNPFDALDGMIARNRGKEPPKDDKKGDDKKPDLRDTTKDKPSDKDPAKPDADKGGAPDRQISSGPKALREQLEKTNGELKAAKTRLAELEAKLPEYEARGKDSTVMSERLAAVEKERDEALSTIRGLRFEASPEFVAKFDKPWKRAVDVAEGVIKQLRVVEQSDSEGNTVPARAATWDDFTRIFQLPYGQAQEEAERLFGKSERIVMSHYDTLHTKQNERQDAIAEERAAFKEREKADQAKAAQEAANKGKRVEEIQSLWRKVNDEIVEKNSEWYAAKPDDKEEAAIVQKALATWDSKPATWQQQVLKDAHVRHGLAGFYLARHRLNKANDRIAELETALAQAKGSKPGDTRRPGAVEKTTEKPWDQDLREALTA